VSRELAGQGSLQAIAQRRFRPGLAGPRAGSPFTGRRPRKTISQLARLDPHTITARDLTPAPVRCLGRRCDEETIRPIG
jgi:hypothetical protein